MGQKALPAFKNALPPTTAISPRSNGLGVRLALRLDLAHGDA